MSVQFVALRDAGTGRLIDGDAALAAGAVSLTLEERGTIERARAGGGRVEHVAASRQNRASFTGWVAGLAVVSSPEAGQTPDGYAYLRNELVLSMTFTNHGLIAFAMALFDVHFSAYFPYLPRWTPSFARAVEEAQAQVWPEIIGSTMSGFPMAMVGDPTWQQARIDTAIRGNFVNDHHFCSATGSPDPGGAYGIYYWRDVGAR